MYPTDEERRLLKGMLALLADEKAPKFKNTKLTAFLPLTGKDYGAELMVVGRAVNGWTLKNWPDGFDYRDCHPMARLDNIIDSVVETSVADDGACPLSWVNNNWHKSHHKMAEINYSTSRSAFWRGIKGVVEALLGEAFDPDHWASRIAWSNLYKVSPFVAGNPPVALVKYIKPACIDLLESEIKARKPQKILYLTGLTWAEPFLAKENVIYLPENQYAEAVYTTCTGAPKITQTGIDGGRIAVIAKHPQGKPSWLWVNEVLHAFDYGALLSNSSK